MTDDEKDPNEWPPSKVFAYKKEHGEYPPGFNDEALKYAFGSGPMLKEAAEKIKQATNLQRTKVTELARSIEGPKVSLLANNLGDEAQKRWDQQQRENQRIADEIAQQKAIQERERQEDRTLIKRQTELAEQSHKIAMWALGVSIVAIVTSILIAIIL